MKKKGLFTSIVNAVVQEEKKVYTTRPRQLFLDDKKQQWYRIMDLIDNLEEETADGESDPTAEKQ